MSQMGGRNVQYYGFDFSFSTIMFLVVFYSMPCLLVKLFSLPLVKRVCLFFENSDDLLIA